MRFIIDNLSSIIAVTVLLAVLALIITVLIRRAKSGKHSCGCDCAYCNKDCGNSLSE